MRFISTAILIFFFYNYSVAQNLYSKTDSVKEIERIYSYTDLLPPEFTSPALENEYYSDSNSVTTADHNYIFILKLRSNCTFIYEIYYKPYNRTRVGFYIGNFTIVSNTIHLVYRPMLSGYPEYIYMSPSTPVSWSLPKRPEYLLIKKSTLLVPNKKGQTKKIFYILKEKLQFKIRICN